MTTRAPAVLKKSVFISILSECPYQQPESGQLCASSPYGDNSCLYSGDLCCCDRCSDYFTFSCVLNSSTGDHHWQSSLCPAEGCGDQGETFSFLDHLNIVLKLYTFFRRRLVTQPSWQLSKPLGANSDDTSKTGNGAVPSIHRI